MEWLGAVICFAIFMAVARVIDAHNARRRPDVSTTIETDVLAARSKLERSLDVETSMGSDGDGNNEPTAQNFSVADLRRLGRQKLRPYRPQESAIETEMPDGNARVDKPMPARGTVDGVAYEIEYADSNGIVTSRVIRVNNVDSENGFAYVNAYCFLAGDERTFRTDRILSMANHRTGAQIRDPVKYFSIFYDADDETVISHEAVMSRARPGLQCLIWVARADNELEDSVIDVMLDYIEVRRSFGPKAANLAWSRDVAKRWLLTIRPTFDTAAGALARLPPAGKAASLARDYIKRVGQTSPKRDRRAARLLKL